jgi:hypothetical protein
MTSNPEPIIVFSLPRSGQNRHVRSDCRKEIGKPPTEKATGWSCSIEGATIEVMQRRPYLVFLLWQSALVMMHLREIAIAAFDGGRSALKSTHALISPCLPLLKGLEGKPLGEHVVIQRGLTRLPRLAQLGFSASTAGVRHVVGPVDAW